MPPHPPPLRGGFGMRRFSPATHKPPQKNPTQKPTHPPPPLRGRVWRCGVCRRKPTSPEKRAHLKIYIAATHPFENRNFEMLPFRNNATRLSCPDTVRTRYIQR